MGASSAAVLGPTYAALGETFEIQVELQVPEKMMAAWYLYGIVATNGATPGPVTGSTAAEQATYHYANTCGWDTSSANVLLGWVSQTAFPVGPMGGVPLADGGTSGVAFRMSVVAPDIWVPCIGVFVTGGLYVDPDTFADTPFEEFPVLRVYIPEPASLLLLLGGLAMSKRKRRRCLGWRARLRQCWSAKSLRCVARGLRRAGNRVFAEGVRMGASVPLWEMGRRGRRPYCAVESASGFLREAGCQNGQTT